MPRSWLINSRGLARKVKNATLPSANQIKDCGANLECPNCHCRIDNRDVSNEWPGLPAGVKFDPSDLELLEHLAAKCGVGNLKPHMFIDEFILTLEGDGGICSAHPENLPGTKKDGSSIHFFYKTVNAYTKGQRKRRRIHDQYSMIKEQVRWHKTGKTKPVMDNGFQKGCKKIMVLYKASKKGSKPDKSNWVMHQYHLGMDEDEKEGQYVVAKILFQQQKQGDKDDNSLVVEESDVGTVRTCPRTPKTTTPNPPRPGKSVSGDPLKDGYILQSPPQEAEFVTETSCPHPRAAQLKDEMEDPNWLAGESQAVDLIGVDDSFLCNEVFDSYGLVTNTGLHHGSFTGFTPITNKVPKGDATSSIADLENLELDTPPDFELTDLQFGSQDSILGWLDRL